MSVLIFYGVYSKQNKTSKLADNKIQSNQEKVIWNGEYI